MARWSCPKLHSARVGCSPPHALRPLYPCTLLHGLCTLRLCTPRRSSWEGSLFTDMCVAPRVRIRRPRHEEAVCATTSQLSVPPPAPRGVAADVRSALHPLSLGERGSALHCPVKRTHPDLGAVHGSGPRASRRKRTLLVPLAECGARTNAGASWRAATFSRCPPPQLAKTLHTLRARADLLTAQYLLTYLLTCAEAYSAYTSTPASRGADWKPA